MARFLGIKGQGASGGCVAELARAGADVAANHEGGGALSPALAHIGAASAAADGVEFVGVDNLFGSGVTGVGADAYFQPFRLFYVFHNGIRS
jgi:hypothetical protein